MAKEVTITKEQLAEATAKAIGELLEDPMCPTEVSVALVMLGGILHHNLQKQLFGEPSNEERANAAEEARRMREEARKRDKEKAARAFGIIFHDLFE